MFGFKTGRPWFLLQSHFAVSGLVLLLTALTSAWFYHMEWVSLSEEFQQEASNISARVQNEIEDLVADVELTGRFIAENPALNRSDFKGLAMLFYAYRKHGHFGIAWAPGITSETLPDFVRRWQAEYGRPFYLRSFPTEPQAVVTVMPGYVFPVAYAEPFETNYSALGLDEGSSAVRSRAMAASLRSGSAVASDLVTLAGQAEEKTGFNVFVPVYFHTGARRGALRGFVIGPFRSAELKKYFSRQVGVFFNIAVFDQTSRNSHQPLVAWAPVARSRSLADFCFQSKRLAGNVSFNLAQHQYQVKVGAMPAFISARATLGFVWTIPWGILFAWLAGWWVRRQGRKLTIAQSSIRQKEAELLKMEEVVQNTSAGLLILNAYDFKTELMNPAYAEMHGYTQEELQALPTDNVITPDTRAWLKRIISENRDRSEFSIEMEHVRKDGTLFPVLHDVVILRDAQGRHKTYIVSERDITERKAVETKVRTLWAYLQAILNSTPFAVVATDSQGIINFFNLGAEKLLGYSAPEVVGKATPLFFHDLDDLNSRWVNDLIFFGKNGLGVDTPFQRLQQIMESESGEDWRFLTKDGRALQVRLMRSSIKNENGEIAGFLEIVEDITEKRIYEVEKNQIQKMSALGQLAAGIAHEINSPMQFISDNLEFFQNHFFGLVTGMDRLAAYGASGKGTVSAREILDLLEKMDFEYLKLEIPKAIKQSLDGAQRVNEIVGSLKDFSHADADGYVSVDCNLVMNDALVITRNVWKKAFTVSKEFDPELPRVEASQGELGQVFINLISNAVDAVSPGGEGAKHQLVLRSRRLEDGGVELSVSDDGPGIPASIQEKIFDPFYTTKSVGQGTGQGLYVSRKIVTERHQGRMFFASSPAGTTFFIQLPASQSKKISHQSVPESVSGSALPS